MGAAGIEIPSMNRRKVEEAYRRAMKARERGEWSTLAPGLRAARSRNPRLLLALEKIAETLDSMGEAQWGRTRRDPGTPFGHRALPTVCNAFREAYRAADAGLSMDNLKPFGWCYYTAFELSGLRM